MVEINIINININIKININRSKRSSSMNRADDYHLYRGHCLCPDTPVKEVIAFARQTQTADDTQLFVKLVNQAQVQNLTCSDLCSLSTFDFRNMSTVTHSADGVLLGRSILKRNVTKCLELTQRIISEFMAKVEAQPGQGRGAMNIDGGRGVVNNGGRGGLDARGRGRGRGRGGRGGRGGGGRGVVNNGGRSGLDARGRGRGRGRGGRGGRSGRGARRVIQSNNVPNVQQEVDEWLPQTVAQRRAFVLQTIEDKGLTYNDLKKIIKINGGKPGNKRRERLIRMLVDNPTWQFDPRVIQSNNGTGDEERSPDQEENGLVPSPDLRGRGRGRGRGGFRGRGRGRGIRGGGRAGRGGRGGRAGRGRRGGRAGRGGRGRGEFGQGADEVVPDVQQQVGGLNQTVPQRRAFVLQTIQDKRLSYNDLKKIIKINGGKPGNNRMPRLIQIMVDNPTYQFDVLVDAPRVIQSNNDTGDEEWSPDQERNGLHGDGPSTNNIDLSEEAASNAEEKETTAEKKQKEYRQKYDTLVCDLKLKAVELLTTLEGVANSDCPLSVELIQKVKEVRDGLDMVWNMQGPQSRRFINRLPCEFLDSRKARIKLINDKLRSLAVEVAKVAVQTRTLIFFSYANADTLGTHPSSKGNMFASTMALNAHYQAVINMRDEWKTVLEAYAENRASLRDNFQEHTYQTQTKMLWEMIEDADNEGLTVSELKAQIMAKPSLSEAFQAAMQSRDRQSNNQSSQNENQNQNENEDHHGLENENEDDSNQEMDVEN